MKCQCCLYIYKCEMRAIILRSLLGFCGGRLRLLSGSFCLSCLHYLGSVQVAEELRTLEEARRPDEDIR